MIEIVKGFSPDRKTKVFLKVSCLQDVVDEMRKKLRLPVDDYLVSLLLCFTKSFSDEFLFSLLTIS